MTAGRGLLTEREREALVEPEGAYTYKTRSVARKRIEKLAEDADLLARHDPDLFDELVEAVEAARRDGERTSTPVDRVEEETAVVTPEPEYPRERADTAAVGGDDLLAEVRSYLTDRPPKTTHGREALLEVFRILREDGTAKTSDLKTAIYSEFGEHYGSERAAWESVSRYLDDVPGVTKGGYGEWEYRGDEAAREELR
ncbi:hypothetical protein [Halorubrum vacuolatum]|uniref:Uncharacterized protein n=1 Tax=Halorubrum vacuolatum TaxID=63740 RepID=A0A238YDH4_HALVU|nr:hypothetical protein [Halorubrum vacuolatum]SNR69100.1 hypothetical protein SAMN06264855_13910 [Halorubrum vacuolatum]